MDNPRSAAYQKRLLQLILESSTRDGHVVILHLREHPSQPGSFTWALQAVKAALTQLAPELELQGIAEIYVTNGYCEWHCMAIDGGRVYVEEGLPVQEPLPVSCWGAPCCQRHPRPCTFATLQPGPCLHDMSSVQPLDQLIYCGFLLLDFMLQCAVRRCVFQ
jgi:hypothetical protein